MRYLSDADPYVGELVDALKNLEILDDTMIDVIIGDKG